MSEQKEYFSEVFSSNLNPITQTEKIIETLLYRFIGTNLPTELTPTINYPAWQTPAENGLVMVDLAVALPNLPVGAKVTLTTYIKSPVSRKMGLHFKCFGPTTFLQEDEEIFQTVSYQENMRSVNSVVVTLNEGLTKLTIVTEKTTMGFGFSLGPDNAKWEPLHFYANPRELGFTVEDEKVLVTQESDSLAGRFLVKIPLSSESEKLKSISSQLKIDTEERLGQLEYVSEDADYFNFAIMTDNLRNSVKKISTEKANATSEILFCGPLGDEEATAINNFSWETLHTGLNGNAIFWQRLEDNRDIRIFSKAPLFGYWNYPMGVSLYGIEAAGKFYDNPILLNYVKQNFAIIKVFYHYGIWDKKKYHYSGINSHLYWLGDLDDCGSFGSALLEASDNEMDTVTREIATSIADFMLKKQRREKDGVFSRTNDTMWIDDLYMSVPFLTRYWKNFHDETALADAILQFQLFKKRMYIPEEKLMSHIYDTNFEVANKIPWSRGNGWVIFSLSELLMEMTNRQRTDEPSVTFFNELVDGLLKVQDTSGLWHQVLDEPTTYLESSSTAMFICAFSRGIRYGFLSPEKVADVNKSIASAWQGLAKMCIDQFGNLYGTCQGSGYSFSKNYYKTLSWNKNDTHGIGIVALAGVEFEKLQKFNAVHDQNKKQEK